MCDLDDYRIALVAASRGELRGLPRTVFVSAFGVAAYQLAFFAAVRSTGVAVGTVVTIGSAAIMTGAWKGSSRGSR